MVRDMLDFDAIFGDLREIHCPDILDQIPVPADPKMPQIVPVDFVLPDQRGLPKDLEALVPLDPVEVDFESLGVQRKALDAWFDVKESEIRFLLRQEANKVVSSLVSQLIEAVIPDLPEVIDQQVEISEEPAKIVEEKVKVPPMAEPAKRGMSNVFSKPRKVKKIRVILDPLL